eukprot:SAG11_NODE_3198_length_2616_cov_1.517282_4_plen_155_part_00
MFEHGRWGHAHGMDSLEVYHRPVSLIGHRRMLSALTRFITRLLLHYSTFFHVGCYARLHSGQLRRNKCHELCRQRSYDGHWRSCTVTLRAFVASRSDISVVQRVWEREHGGVQERSTQPPSSAMHTGSRTRSVYQPHSSSGALVWQHNIRTQDQ